MNLLLTHGYFIHEDPVEAGIMKPYPPLGLLYLSAWLKKSGIPHEVYDTTFADMTELKARLESYRPGIIGIYSTLMTRPNVIEIMAFVNGNHVFRETKIIIGGPDARHHAEEYLLHGADMVVPGEGEETLAELAGVLSSGAMEDLYHIRGFFFRDKDGVVRFTGERETIDLKEVPFPSYENIDVTEYLHRWKSFHGYSSMTINAMRGCPYSCNWCSKSVFGNTYRRRTPVSVVEEMILLVNTFNPDQVWFTDDVFTISKEWISEFSNEIQKRNISLPYECITRSDCLDEEVAGMLKRSGCRKVWIGAESGSQKVIDRMNRKIDLVWTAEMIATLKSLGISAGIFIMLGYPGETKKDIFQTACFLKKTLPDDLTVGMAYPIKGTKYYEITEPVFDIPYDWKTMTERQIRFKKPYSGRFYRFSTRYLFNSVAFKRPERDAGKWIFFFKAIISKIYILLFY